MVDDPAGDGWRRWSTAMAGLADRLQHGDFPTDERGRAEGIRHLARQAALALQGEVDGIYGAANMPLKMSPGSA